MKLLENKCVMITGANRGIGKAMACCFAQEGAKLVLITRPESEKDLHACAEKCKQEGASEVMCHTCDVSDPDALEECCKKFEGMHVDVLVNNAGVFGPTGEGQGPLHGSMQEWHKTLHVNVMAPMILTKHMASKMVEKGEGWIINIGDLEGTHTGPRHPLYAATKHALRGYSLACYEQLRHHNIKVCLINPGNVCQTGMVERTDKTRDGQGCINPEDVAEAALLCFKMSQNAVPAEIDLKAVKAETGGMAASREQ